MPLNDIGPKGFVEGLGVSELSYTPLFDRAGVITGISVFNSTFPQTWIIEVQGRELARFYEPLSFAQHLLIGSPANFPNANSIFDFSRARMNDTLIYPVPLGQTFTIRSADGSTADIMLTYTEVSPGEISPNMVNHPSGRRFIVPLWGFRAAPVTAIGENPFDTQVGPNWFPNIFVDGILPPDWNIQVVEMFLQGCGVNTFSGAADHQSATSHLAIIKNGQRLYTRDPAGGVPLIGTPAPPGGAGIASNTLMTPFPDFQEVDDFDRENMGTPLVFGPGNTIQLRLGIDGDVTGGADYSQSIQVFICDVRIGGGV